MPTPGNIEIPIIDTGIVKAVNTRDRTVDIILEGSDRGLYGVIVANDPGSYSFPQVNDLVLVITADQFSYCLGKIEKGFRDKIDGKVKDQVTDTVLQPREVQGGETYLANLAKKAWLYIAKSGNLSLMSGLNDGFKYFFKTRFLRIAAQTIRTLGFGSTMQTGSVVRDTPEGKTTVPSDVATVPAVEHLVDLTVNKIPVALFQIGQLFTNAAVPIPLKGSFGSRLRAILQVHNATGLPAASLKMDEVGNVELVGTLGNLLLNGLTTIQLGGLAAAEQVIKGTTFISHLNTFLGKLSAFCTAVNGACAVVGSQAQNAAALTAIGNAANVLKGHTDTFIGQLSATLSTKTKTV